MSSASVQFINVSILRHPDITLRHSDKKLYLYDRTDDFIILCQFGSSIISGYRVTGVGAPGPRKPKRARSG